MLLGAAGLLISYLLQFDQWWSSTLITVSGAIFLVGPLTFFAKKIEERTESSLTAMGDQVEQLRRTVAEGQEGVSRGFADALDRRRDAILRSRSNEAFEDSHNALKLMEEAGVISSAVGARARIPNSPHYLRLVPKSSSICIFIDDVASTGYISRTWTAGDALSDLMVEIASEMRKSGEWLGEKSFDYAAAFAGIGDGLILFDSFHHEGIVPTSAFFEDVGGGWFLTDSAIEHAPGHKYYIDYRRLDEQDWYRQLREKAWVDSDSSDKAIDQAKIIRELFSK